jgi:hypothetical protein
MPSPQFLTLPTEDQEEALLPLALVLAELRLDLAVDSDDAAVQGQLLLLKLNRTAAREYCEQYCGRPFASGTVTQTFRLDEEYVLDPLAGEVTGVTGFFTDVTQLPTTSGPFFGSTYLAEYIKGISVNRQLPLGEAFSQPFTVTYNVNADATNVPAAVRKAMLKLIGDFYENREASVTGTPQIATVLSVEKLLAPYRLTNVLY